MSFGAELLQLLFDRQRLIMAAVTPDPPVVHTVLASAMSGFMSRIPCHPMDTIKARLQSAHGSHYTGIAHCLRLTLAEEGFRGLYRGFGAVAVAGTPAACVYLTTYEVLKSKLVSKDSKNTAFLGHFWAGMGAEAASCLVFVPVDVIKERLQVQQSPPGAALRAEACSSGSRSGRSSAVPAYSGSWDAFRVISRSEGILGLYKGYYATLASFGPFSALYFVFYEQARAVLGAVSGRSDSASLPAGLTMAASAGAGAAAAVVTCPLDLAKLRLQTQRRLRAGEPLPDGHLRGLGDGLRLAWREGGVRALFRGAGARAAFHAPSTCIAFTSFEECKKLVQQVI
ncbi:unnamed protein product [Polarella glacialis]|uniref:Mitochondrial carrier protein n=1 Tax=Polarella glacialis TaxID=89957 RepID=A0A813L9U0_POLGL|nr:unnamed protein product [Polarella glacialis]